MEDILQDTGCGNVQPKIYREGLKIVKEDRKNTETNSKEYLPPQKVLEIFKKITNEIIQIFGFDPTYAKPEAFIISNFPIPPHPVKPSIKHNTIQRGEDYLTHKLFDIVKESVIH